MLVPYTTLCRSLALHRQPVGVVHQAVEDGVGQGRVIDPAMPVFEGQLAGQDGGAVAGAVVDHFQQVMPSRSAEHTSELQSLMPTSSAVFCLRKHSNHTLTHYVHALLLTSA